MPTTGEIEWTPTMHAILGSEPSLQLYGEVSVWFHKLGLFRKGEEDRVHLASPTAADLRIHKQLLLRLITDGEHLLRLAGECGGLISNPEAIKLEDLHAAVESLRDSYRGWHQPMPPEQRDKILGEVFADVP